jgi:transketolase
MAAAMNGMALHGGVIPYGGTFLCFSDYCRPSIRLSALMGIRNIFVMTHDSIGLGEDGPTHQPVEQLAALRAIPNHVVYRPADAVETAECWQLALESQKNSSTLALTRQNLPTVRTEYTSENLSAKGAYELAPASGKAEITIFASGSEVEIALAAREKLEKKGHKTRVVSVPSFELFFQQDAAYREKTIGDAPVRIAVEAAIRQGWDEFIGSDGLFVGMTGFGASGKIEDLYPHFGITADHVVKAAEGALAKKS